MIERLLDHPWGRRVLASLPFLLVVLPHLDFVPLWDGAVYGECLEKSVSRGLDLWTLNCAGHPSMLYMLPLAFAWKLGAGAMWPVLLVNALFGAVGIAAYLDLLDFLVPSVPSRERLLGAAVFGLVPPIAASTLNLTVDFGTLVFFLLLLCAMLRERWWWAAAAGVALAFTKEPGIALAGLATICFLLAQVWLRPGTVREKLFSSLRAAPMLLVPLAFAIYLVVRSTRHEALFWDANGNTSLASLFALNLRDRVFRSFLASVFTVNFMWIPAALVIAGFATWLFSRLRRRGPASAPVAVFAGLLLVGSMYLLTRYRTFTNVRYFLPLFPLTLACAHVALARLTASSAVRAGTLAAMALLFAVSSSRTVDPLSRRIFGTFRWGEHDVLRMVSLTGECCGYSRDQLVYNLEFLAFDDLLGDVLETERPTNRRPLVIPELTNWFILEAMTPGEAPRRAPIHAGFPHPPYATVEQLLKSNVKPPEVVWVALANADGRREQAMLEEWYAPESQRTFDRGGYTVVTTSYRRRGSAAAGAVP